MVYTSVDNEKIKYIKKLENKKFRDSEGLFLVEGDHLVKEAYNQNLLKTLIVSENETFKIDNVDTMIVNDKILKFLTSLDNPKKVLGVCYKPNKSTIGDHIIALDGVQDPGNIGTIIRSSVAFNIDTILLSSKCCDIYNPKVVRATQGLIFYPNIIYCNLEDTIKSLNGYDIIGTSVVNGIDVKKIDKKNKYVIVMGSEGTGVSKEVSDLCNSFIYIKMNKNCESLNVAVAASLILYELDK